MTRGAVFLLALGLLQMAADVLHLTALKAVANATGASPAPKVFSTVKGLETFSSEFYVEWRDHNGSWHSLKITPELYSRIKGPYNRRNVFGAALAYAPVLDGDLHTKPMYVSVVRYALCGQAPLLGEVGIDADLSAPPSIRLVTRPGSRFGEPAFLIVPHCQ